MFWFVGAAINPQNWIRDMAGSDPDPLSHGTVFYQTKIPQMHTFWPVTFVNILTGQIFSQKVSQQLLNWKCC